MKTSERVEQAFKRIKELITLVADWTKNPKEDELTKVIDYIVKAKSKVGDALETKRREVANSFVKSSDAKGEDEGDGEV